MRYSWPKPLIWAAYYTFSRIIEIGIEPSCPPTVGGIRENEMFKISQ
jgi:hypothetical protein